MPLKDIAGQAREAADGLHQVVLSVEGLERAAASTARSLSSGPGGNVDPGVVLQRVNERAGNSVSGSPVDDVSPGVGIDRINEPSPEAVGGAAVTRNDGVTLAGIERVIRASRRDELEPLRQQLADLADENRRLRREVEALRQTASAPRSDPTHGVATSVQISSSRLFR